jgi:hypothetical protein
MLISSWGACIKFIVCVLNNPKLLSKLLHLLNKLVLKLLIGQRNKHVRGSLSAHFYQCAVNDVNTINVLDDFSSVVLLQMSDMLCTFKRS